MKEFSPKEIRNIALVSHLSAGKTTLAEAFLFSAGEITRLGTIDEGTTTSDFRSDEIERKISISASLLSFEWKKSKINLIDIPGYLDFFGEVISGVRVSDLAIILLNSVSGVEVGTDFAWDILERNNIPAMLYVNFMDKEHANFDKVVKTAKEAYGNNVIMFQFPVTEGEKFNSIIDLLKMKKITFNTDLSGKYTQEDIPADLANKAKTLRNELIEKIAESDDALLEKYFEAGELAEDEINIGLKKGLLKRSFFPVFCGVASKNLGPQLMLDFIAEFGPSPADITSVPAFDKDNKEITIKVDENAPFSALVFKTISEMHVGELSLIKVYSGSIKSGDEVLNTANSTTEKIGQIYTLNGKNRKEIGVLKTGDIGALVKLRNTHTSNTLCDKRNPVKFAEIQFPEPVVEIAVTPKSKGDEDKISSGLHTLHEIDPSFTVRIDPELKQTVVAGQGEMHLTIILKRLKERYTVDVEQKKPKIPYRETITAKADEKYRHKKQSGGAGQFAEVWMRIEPTPRGSGFEFASAVVGGAISSSFIPSIEKGVQQVLVEGAVAGYKIVDVKAIVYDGKEHPVDSKDIAFQIAGREVFKMCMKSAKPILLEPICNVEIRCPEEYMGDVMGDLSSRRGKITGMEMHGRFQVVKAQVPLAELHNYATTLRSLTQGRATHTRKISHYDPLPKELEAKVVEESQAENK
ncbi:MAG TPA: elongation factor G [bacterium]|nr:elongation factor G [bacterium]HPN43610.1 elongation factor G [bacterium]